MGAGALDFALCTLFIHSISQIAAEGAAVLAAVFSPRFWKRKLGLGVCQREDQLLVLSYWGLAIGGRPPWETTPCSSCWGMSRQQTASPVQWCWVALAELLMGTGWALSHRSQPAILSLANDSN